MPKGTEKQTVEEQFNKGLNINSLDLLPMPKSGSTLPQRQNVTAPERQVTPEASRRAIDPAARNYADVADEDLPRPKRDNQSPGDKIASSLEIPLTAASGYWFARKGGYKIAAQNSEKLHNLSDHAIKEELAVDFGRSRIDLTKELKTRYEASVLKVNEVVASEPHLFDEGYRFEFNKTGVSEEMSRKLYRGNNIGEVIGALDNIPVKDLTTDQIKQVGEYAEHLSGSPLLKDEGLAHHATTMNANAAKLAEAEAHLLANTGSLEMKVAAENEFYSSIRNLRTNLGAKKLEADAVVQAIAKEQPDLLEFGRRFEFDPDITPEKVAELKRPTHLNGLIEAIDKTHAPGSKVLITSQGEHLKALSGLSQDVLIQSEGLTEMAGRLEANAAKVVESRVKAFSLLSSEQATFMKKSMGVLGAGIATNWVIDKALFDGHKPGLISYAADLGAPAVLLTGLSMKVKFGVMVGAHIAARLSEKPEPEYRKKRQ